uniref:SJCHGC03719 protein n=1 Tax=Schistosoma japonicum TaxID=6182 RepID=Q5DHV0_SCHJA|nr:SJCHGC03719 protein [Schistosoma japonicum]
MNVTTKVCKSFHIFLRTTFPGTYVLTLTTISCHWNLDEVSFFVVCWNLFFFSNISIDIVEGLCSLVLVPQLVWCLSVFICWMTTLVFLILGRSTLIGRTVDAASVTGKLNGVGLIKSSSKYSIHPFGCLWVSMIGLPFLFLAGNPNLLLFQLASSVHHMGVTCFHLLKLFPLLLLGLPRGAAYQF